MFQALSSNAGFLVHSSGLSTFVKKSYFCPETREIIVVIYLDWRVLYTIVSPDCAIWRTR